MSADTLRELHSWWMNSSGSILDVENHAVLLLLFALVVLVLVESWIVLRRYPVRVVVVWPLVSLVTFSLQVGVLWLLSFPCAWYGPSVIDCLVDLFNDLNKISFAENNNTWLFVTSSFCVMCCYLACFACVFVFLLARLNYEVSLRVTCYLCPAWVGVVVATHVPAVSSSIVAPVPVKFSFTRIPRPVEK
jgi:hypothetical protein